MTDLQRQASCLRILAHALVEMAEVLDTPPMTVKVKRASVRSTKIRMDGSQKMWARSLEEKRVALATVLGFFVVNGGIITKEQFKAVARSVGYDTRGLASFSTAKTDLVQRDPSDPSKRRLTAKGYDRYARIKQFDKGYNAAA